MQYDDITGIYLCLDERYINISIELIFQLKYQMNNNCNEKDIHTLEYLNNKGKLEQKGRSKLGIIKQIKEEFAIYRKPGKLLQVK